MSAADKKKLDGLSHAESISSLAFSNDSSKMYMGVKFSANRVSARFLVMENNGRRADIYVSICIGIDTKATVYASWNTDTEFRIFYDNEGYIYVIFNCSAWSNGSCISTKKNDTMTQWNGTSYPSNLTAITTDIRYTLDSTNFTRYALDKDGTAKKAKAMSDGTLRSGFYVNSAANATSGYTWFRMATCKISSAYETVNTTFLITNGMVGHALLSCGIRNDGTGKAAESCSLNFSARNGGIAMPSDMFRVVAINSSTGVTYELWGQISSRWSAVRYTVLDERNISGGKYNIWALESHSDADAKTAPTTGNYYVNSSDISICATATKANEATTLTDSGWVTCPLAVTGNTTYPSSSSNIKVRKYGKLVRLEAVVKYTTAFGAGHNVAKIPEGYRPSSVQKEHGIITVASERIEFDATLSVGGNLSFEPAGSSSAKFNPGNSYECRMTYFID